MQLHVVQGFAELSLGSVPEAIESFSNVVGPPTQDQSILHRYDRLYAQLGMAEAALVTGDLSTAREEAARLAQAVSGLDESTIKALTWELNARLAHDAPDAAEAHIQRALESMTAFEVPMAAWRVYATAAAISSGH